MLRLSFAVVCVLLGTCIAGCAGGGSVVTGPGDGSVRDGGARDGATDAGAVDAARRDAATVTCPTGEHACGGGCVDDQPNEPENGCRLGCGEECPTPPDGTASCNTAGMCDFACDPPAHREGDTCVCVTNTCEDLGFECGAPDDGCGTPLDCGTCATGSCVEGHCACMPDPHEANESPLAATRGPDLSDADDPDLDYTDYTIDEATDVDWLQFHISDDWEGLSSGNPRITVRLTGVPVGSDYDLAAYYGCDEGGDDSSCNQGTSDSMIGHGCVSSHPGSVEEVVEIATECDNAFSTDDHGTLFVRVTAPTFGGSCEAYHLAVSVR